MEEEEDFLAAVEADNATAPEPPKEDTPEAKPEAEAKEPGKDGPPRDEHGRFAPKAEAEAPAEEAQPQPPASPAPPAEPAPAPAPTPAPAEVPHAPLTALLDEREKRQAAERELQALRQQQAERQIVVPDPDMDPAGYAQFQDQRFQTAILNVTLNTSERLAVKEHGKETVEAAKAWSLQRFSADPLYQQQVLGHPDPYEKVVSDYRREQLFEKVSDPSEFDEFLKWKAAQGQIQQQPVAPATPPNPSPSIPPPSLASAPSAGSVLVEPAQSQEEIFDETFPKR